MKRIAVPCLGVILLPAMLGGQQPSPSASPSARNPITQTVKGFGYLGGWLLAAFDSIPASQYGFRPTPPQQTVGHIAQHLENANYQLCARFSGRVWRAT